MPKLSNGEETQEQAIRTDSVKISIRNLSIFFLTAYPVIDEQPMPKEIFYPARFLSPNYPLEG